MELGSVRALKAELAETVVRPLVEERHGLRSMAVSARSLERTTGIRPGIALGVTRGETEQDYRLAVRVQQRQLERGGALREHLTKAARGEIDYSYIGRVTKRQLPWTQQRQRPLLIGCSVGHVDVTVGTLGAFAHPNHDDQILMLSNNHVLAMEDAADIGDAIVQPGRLDDGEPPEDVVATLFRFAALQTSGNLVDAAVARLVPGIKYDRSTIRGDGMLRGVRPTPVMSEDRVLKLGRTTVLTRGKVTAAEFDNLVVEYDRGLLSFDDQIEIEGAGNEAFSAGGDSGSVIVDEDGLACALLFAGSDIGGTNGMGLTYANDIRKVLQALDVRLAV